MIDEETNRLLKVVLQLFTKRSAREKFVIACTRRAVCDNLTRHFKDLIVPIRTPEYQELTVADHLVNAYILSQAKVFESSWRAVFNTHSVRLAIRSVILWLSRRKMNAYSLRNCSAGSGILAIES